MKLEIYLTNLNLYTQGYLIGKFVKLPIREEDLQTVLNEIGVDGINYEEYFITDIETDISGLSECISEYTSIAELNALAELLDELNEADEEKLTAILECESFSKIVDIVDLIENIDDWVLCSDINDEEDLGYYFAEDVGAITIPENLKGYFDYERYGRDLRLELGGTFTSFGFVYGEY